MTVGLQFISSKYHSDIHQIRHDTQINDAVIIFWHYDILMYLFL